MKICPVVNIRKKVIGMISDRYRYSIFSCLVRCLLACMVVFCCCWNYTCHAGTLKGMKKHICIYGASKILSKYANEIASSYDTIITDSDKYSQVCALKKINFNIRALCYRDSVAMFSYYDDWAVAIQHKEWFVKDVTSAGRIKNKAFGWYLMDITNQDYRNHLINYIDNKLSKYPLFDGVFLDDTSTVINPNLFVIEGNAQDSSNSAPRFSTEFNSRYHGSVKVFLSELKKRVGNKLIIINSNDSCDFLTCVDGQMFEGFVHGSWQESAYFPTVKQWRKYVLDLQKLVATDKVILVHAGSRGKNTECYQQFLFSFTSYLLCYGKKTSFYFDLPSEKDKIPNFIEYNLNIGKPCEEITIPEDQVIFHDSFEELKGWSVFNSSSIYLDSNNSHGTGSLRFNGQHSRGCYLQRYIELPSSSEITISCWAKGTGIIPGDISWNRFALLGKFHNAEKKVIKGGIDLPFDTNTFEWKCYNMTYPIPPNTKYLFINALGFCPTSQGVGWVDDLQVTALKKEASLFKREFENGIVYVNPTYSLLEFTVTQKLYDIHGNPITHVSLAGHSGSILLKSPLPSSPKAVSVKLIAPGKR